MSELKKSESTRENLSKDMEHAKKKNSSLSIEIVKKVSDLELELQNFKSENLKQQLNSIVPVSERPFPKLFTSTTMKVIFDCTSFYVTFP